MKKEELILKLQLEIDCYKQLYDVSLGCRRIYYSSKIESISLIIEDIKNLNVETVKLVKGCTCSIYHGDSNNKFCTLCGKELYPNLQPE